MARVLFRICRVISQKYRPSLTENREPMHNKTLEMSAVSTLYASIFTARRKAGGGRGKERERLRGKRRTEGLRGEGEEQNRLARNLLVILHASTLLLRFCPTCYTCYTPLPRERKVEMHFSSLRPSARPSYASHAKPN